VADSVKNSNYAVGGTEAKLFGISSLCDDPKKSSPGTFMSWKVQSLVPDDITENLDLYKIVMTGTITTSKHWNLISNV